MAVGLAIAQQMIQQQGASLIGGGPGGTVSATPVAAGAVTSKALPDLMTPAQVAEMLTVPESDVLSLMESGKLKAKKIGSSWRVKRSALEAYLAD